MLGGAVGGGSSHVELLEAPESGRRAGELIHIVEVPFGAGSAAQRRGTLPRTPELRGAAARREIVHASWTPEFRPQVRGNRAPARAPTKRPAKRSPG